MVEVWASGASEGVVAATGVAGDVVVEHPRKEALPEVVREKSECVISSD